MKILFVTDLYPLENENCAKALFYIIQEWMRQGHEVEVIKSNFIFNSLIRGRKIFRQKIYNQNGVKIYNLNFHTPFLFNVYHKLPKGFSLKNYDVIISHMPCGALMAQKLLKRDKIKYICGVHASDIVVLKDFKYSIYFKNQLKKAYLNADKIAARSPVLQKKIEEIIPETEDKTFVAYSGLNDEILNRELKPKFFNEKTFQISTAASLIKRKNIDIIIKALKLCNRNDFKLTIIGDGSQKRSLEKLAKKLQLEKNIVFTGKLTREEVFKNLSDSDIFILISDNETFGLAYLEAMAENNIIIAKKGDGIDGILQDNQNAFLINPDVIELKNCLEKIFSMSEKEIEIIKQNTIDTIKQLTLSKAAENYIKNIQ